MYSTGFQHGELSPKETFRFENATFVILSSGELDLNHSLGHVSRHEMNE